VDNDLGLGKSMNNPFFSFSFKTPTVRNVELTAPYMHNGVYKNLEQVVNFYDHAGGEKFRQANRNYAPNLVFFTIIPIELKLTEPEKKDLVAFMKSLTDTSAAKAPSKLPVIKGKYAHLNERKIGGEY
jgi:cytochrome c peroxidase